MPRKDTTPDNAKVDWCSSCSRRSNKNCEQCIFAAHNIKGIELAFGAKSTPAQRRLGYDMSPQVQKAMQTPISRAVTNLDHVLNRPNLPHVIIPSYNQIAKLSRAVGLS